MPPFNALLPPLLGGYLFISWWNRTAFSAQRSAGYRLVFDTAVAGLFFLVLAYLITQGIDLACPGLSAWWRAAVPFSYSGTSLLAFAIGALGWWPLNKLGPSREEAIHKAIQGAGDPLEQSLSEAERSGTLLEIQLASGRFYVGYVSSLPSPSIEPKFIGLYPAMEGYRDEETQTLVYETEYVSYFAEESPDVAEGELPTLDPDKLGRISTTIPVSQIVSTCPWQAKVAGAQSINLE